MLHRVNIFRLFSYDNLIFDLQFLKILVELQKSESKTEHLLLVQVVKAGLFDTAVQVMGLFIIRVLVWDHVIKDLDILNCILFANDGLLDIQAWDLA